ncbi:MAG: AsmA-like C-terminal domain-containing protein [Desulfobacterales bacterium]
MSKSRKIVAGAVIGIVSVVILLLVAVLVLPKVIESETLKAKIRSEFSRTVGGEIDFDRLDFSVFPHPHLKLNKASVMLPKKLAGSAEIISVTPKILQLLSGKIGFREIRVQQPDVTITLQKSLEEEKTPAKSPAVSDVMRQIVSVFAMHPALQLPDVDGYVENGRFKLVYDDRAAVELDHVEGRLTNTTGSLTFQVAGTSTAVESVSISGTADSRESRGNTRIQLTRLQPQVVRDTFFPEFALKMQAAPVDLTIDVNLDGPGQMRADIGVSISEFSLARENKIVEMRNRELKGRFDLDKNSAAVSLTELVLDYPQMSVAGHLASSVHDAQLRMEIEGRNIDVKTTRQAALALSGENNVIRGIFGVLKGGTVPLITLTAQGQALSDLGDMDTLVIRGQMRDGDIAIPGVQLDLTDTAGDVVISRGILEGENLRARLGNSNAENGKLTVGLVGDEAPFHLEIDVRADLAQLPPILDRLIDNKDFRSELAKIEDLNGNANGKLVLGEDINNVNVTVAASDIHLSARYRGIPHPVAVTGGNFSYTPTGIGIRQLHGSLGKSTFTDLSGGLEWGKKSELEMSSGPCNIYLAEIVPWLASFDALRDELTYYGGGQGSIGLSALKVKGPLQTPRDWLFDVAGEVEDLLLVNLPEPPGTVKVTFAKFKADSKTFTYTDGQMSLKDAPLKISGTHRDYLKGFDKDVSLILKGRLGPQFVEWLARVLGAPSWLKLRPQTLAPSKLRYVRGEKNTLSVSIATQDGLGLSTDILLGVDELTVDKLSIQDPDSRATVGLHVKGGAVDLAFDGKIYQQTLNRFFSKGTFLAESIDGKMRARWDPQNPSKSNMEGDLRGRNIFVAYDPATPLKINSFVLRGDASKIRIDTADLNWSEMPLKLSGTIQPESDNRLGLDLDIAADAVDLDRLIQVLKSGPENKEPQAGSTSEPFPLVGNIRFKVDRLTFSDLAWTPLHADVSLNKANTDITINEAALCGISTPGTLTLSPEAVRFDIKTVAKDQELGASLNCFIVAESAFDQAGVKTVKTLKADGTYSLKGRFQGSGKAEDLLKTATGQVEGSAVDGHIYQDVILLNVLKYLNTSELLTGQTNLKKMETEGFGYRSIKIEASLQDGKISYKKAILDGPSMALTGVGEQDLLTGQLDMNLLVTLQVTLGRVLDKLPLVGGVLQGLNTIPLGVKGTLNNVRIQALAPSSVSYDLKTIMENTVKGPIKLLHIGKKPAADGKTSP